jgi:hypothetical protein
LASVEPPVAHSSPDRLTPVDVVDAALAAALDRAAAAGQWSTVAVLAGELAARRSGRETPSAATTATAGADVVDPS